ncbi:flotillin family protein [Campylobacter showae]|uniref:Inner membrane protein YqiK n=1 Tax=Campylobacter showae CSUNSWCD TaxID=1244083 RepID=M5ILN7_9BACT|nr:flotillin domain-containing protein [Campylobacter showae]EKU12115.1 Inner membrane protein YqiK [Campylobacter showae CSUNSWCD]
MNIDAMTSMAVFAGIGLFSIIILGIVFSRLYRKTTKELTFVRTGFGGEKVVVDGGALILPILHDYIDINMQSMKVTVARSKSDSFITKDRMRVDITADFYIRVGEDRESISRAAQTLGKKTIDLRELTGLIEGKLIATLRSVASSMEMKELHEKRDEFSSQVKNAIEADLSKNGLQLESVSLTSLDQTAKEFFNENNAFDAEGLTSLTQTIEERKKLRNDIERSTEVQIAQKNYETQSEKFEIQRKQAEAEATQQTKIANFQAEQEALRAKEAESRRKEAEEAKIVANKAIEEAQINKARAIETVEIEKARAIREAEINKEKAVELANQSKNIEIAKKVEEEAAAKTLANEKKALEAASFEKIKTSSETEQAERAKKLALIEAQKEAEQLSIEKTVAAKAEKEAEENLAEAAKIKAMGASEALKIKATAEAEAIKITAEANRLNYEVEAKGKTEINNAENIVSAEILENRFKLALVEFMPQIIAQVVKPAEKIDSIKIVQMAGLGGANQGGIGSNTNGVVSNAGASLSDQIVNASLNYKVNAPIIDDLMKQVGIDLNGGIQNIASPLLDGCEKAKDKSNFSAKETEKFNAASEQKDSKKK